MNTTIRTGTRPARTRTRAGALAGAALAAGALLTAAHPARAQFPVSLGENQSAAPSGPLAPGQTRAAPYARPSYLSFSPLTLFQIKNSFLNINGQKQTTSRTDFGPFLQYEKHSPLRQNVHGQDSYAALGAWYWYHGQKEDMDRFAVYGQYFYTPHIGVELNLGGSTQGEAAGTTHGPVPSGLYEYYGFLLYSPSLGARSKFGLQVGVGPYLVRSSVGSAGYTYTLGGIYRLSPTLSLSASGWYVNYKAKSTQGLGNTANNLLRSQVAVVYNFK